MSEHREHSPAGSAPPETVTRAVCQQCFEFLDAGDNFCRYCGEMTERGAAMVKIGKLSPRKSRETAARAPSWIENPVVVLLALFLVLGPLALPMLWHSRRFNRGWKIGLTCAVLLMTVAVCWQAAAVLQKDLEPLLQELRR